MPHFNWRCLAWGFLRLTCASFSPAKPEIRLIAKQPAYLCPNCARVSRGRFEHHTAPMPLHNHTLIKCSLVKHLSLIPNELLPGSLATLPSEGAISRKAAVSTNATLSPRLGAESGNFASVGLARPWLLPASCLCCVDSALTIVTAKKSCHTAIPVWAPELLACRA